MAWILAGGSHHSVLSTAATAEMIEDWAEIMGIEFVHITKDTELERLKTRLFLSDLVAIAITQHIFFMHWASVLDVRPCV